MVRLSSRRLMLAAVAGAVALSAAGCGNAMAIRAPSTAHRRTVPSAPSAPSPKSPPSTTPTTLPGTPGGGELTKALAAAEAQKWAHVSDTAGDTNLTTVCGPTSGTQTVTVDGITGQVVVVPGTTYVQGDAAALSDLFSLPAATAQKVTGQWVALTSKDSEYHDTTIGVTLPSMLSQVTIKAPVKMRPATYDGQSVIEITGGLPASADSGTGTVILLVTNTASPLPIRYLALGSKGQNDLVFSDWGQAATVAAPAKSVPLPATPGGTGAPASKLGH